MFFDLIETLSNGAEVWLTPKGVTTLLQRRGDLGLHDAEAVPKLNKFRGRIVHAPRELVTRDGTEAQVLVIATAPREIRGHALVLPWGCLKVHADVVAALPALADASARYLLARLKSVAAEIGEIGDGNGTGVEDDDAEPTK
jgi:hypothetical protein